MNRLVTFVLACALVAFGPPAQAGSVDTSKLLTLTSGSFYLCEELDGRQLPTGRIYTLAVSLDANGRCELDLDQNVPFDLGALGTVPLGVRRGSFVVAKSPGWILFDVRSGFSLLDEVDGAAVIPKGVPIPRLMTPDLPKHLSVAVRDGSGTPLWTGGVEIELITLNYNLARGWLVSWTFDAGQSCSLWADGRGNLAGVEFDWTLYRIIGAIPGGTSTGVR